jgi:hypothetical protein
MSVRIIKGRKLTDREIAEVTTPPGRYLETRTLLPFTLMGTHI